MLCALDTILCAQTCKRHCMNQCTAAGSSHGQTPTAALRRGCVEATSGGQLQTAGITLPGQGRCMFSVHALQPNMKDRSRHCLAAAVTPTGVQLFMTANSGAAAWLRASHGSVRYAMLSSVLGSHNGSRRWVGCGTHSPLCAYTSCCAAPAETALRRKRLRGCAASARVGNWFAAPCYRSTMG